MGEGCFGSLFLWCLFVVAGIFVVTIGDPAGGSDVDFKCNTSCILQKGCTYSQTLIRYLVLLQYKIAQHRFSGTMSAGRSALLLASDWYFIARAGAKLTSLVIRCTCSLRPP